ncbi:MAG: hypothetical protein KUG72_11740 [Pseudomonadales bacterium]|nr:hypothetical protein [Pseudomonadales bacterium]
MRINVRLAPSSEQALEYLKQNTGLGVTQIIKHSLELYVAELQSKAGRLRCNQQLLADLAGIGQGPVGLSENYKSYLDKLLDEKYPVR